MARCDSLVFSIEGANHNTIRMNRANLVVPDSKARTKIARDRNASGNSASAKNKAVAANKAAINKEATSKADDKSGLIGVFGRRGVTPRRSYLSVVTARFQFKSYYNRRLHSARLCFYEIKHKG